VSEPQLRAVPDVGDHRSADELLVASSRGDREAYEALFDRVAPKVVGVCRRVVRDPARSEEVAQEVLTEVWRSAKRFDPDKGSAMTWIMTIAHRRSVDCVRSVQASRDRDERVGRRDRDRAFDVVSEEVEIREDHERVREALDQLTDLQREVVDLAYYGGHTYREVAELLDTPLGTIKTRMRDGLIRLRDAMGVDR
jgi:RNA polymerase sigma-70 factor (ECF subfamily)